MPLEKNKLFFFSSKGILYLIVFLFILSRLWVLDRGIFMWNDEELYNGTIAMELLHGLNLPFFDYQYVPHHGGTISVGILATIFFTIFGNSYFSLKLVALLLATLSLIFCLILLNRHFSKKVAVIAGLLFLFSPSLYTESNLIAQGIHGDSVFLSMLTILIFYEIFFSEKGYYLNSNKKSYLIFIVFGLVSGFSLYFAYITLYCLATCLLFWFLFDKKFILKKTFLFFSLSFLTGFSPWLYYNSINSFKGIDIIRKYWLNYQENPSVLKKTVEYFTLDLPALFDFNEIKFLRIAVLPYFYYFVLLAAFFFILFKEKDSFVKFLKVFIPSKNFNISSGGFSKELFFLIAPVIFSIIYLLSNILVFYKLEEKFTTFRYFTPLFPFIFIILSLAFSKYFEKFKELKSIPGIIILIMLLFLGLIGNIRIPFYDKTLNYHDLDGFSYERLGWITVKKFGFDFQKYIELGNRINPIYRHLYYHGVGWCIGGRGLVWIKGFEEFKKMEELIQNVENKYKSYYYQGLGYNLGSNCVYNYYEKCIEEIGMIDEKYRTYAYLGMSMVVREDWRKETDIPKIVSTVDLKYRRFFSPLLGEYLLINKGSLDAVEDALEKFTENDRAYAFQGVGSFLFKNCYYRVKKFREIIQYVPFKYRDSCYDGAGESIGFYLRNRINEIGREINKFSLQERILVCRGIGRYITERYGFYFPKIITVINILEKQYHPYLFEGVGAQIAWRFGDDKEVSNSILKQLAPEYKSSVEKGFEEELAKTTGFKKS